MDLISLNSVLIGKNKINHLLYKIGERDAEHVFEMNKDKLKPSI